MTAGRPTISDHLERQIAIIASSADRSTSRCCPWPSARGRRWTTHCWSTVAWRAVIHSRWNEPRQCLCQLDRRLNGCDSPLTRPPWGPFGRRWTARIGRPPRAAYGRATAKP